MSLSSLLSPLQHSAYIQNLVTERTEHLRLELQKIDGFIKAWSHDIGMPVHGMKAALGLLKNAQDSKDFIYVLDVLYTGCQILSDIHSNIGEFLNGYNDKVRTEDIELTNWLPPVVDLYRPLASDKDIQINLDINNDKAFIINSDKLKLTRVIANLIGNAIKYTPHNKGKVITIRAYNKAAKLHIEVQDEGIGIPQDKLIAIFQPYVRLDTKGPGLGIGLSICQTITEQLHGSISVTSAVSEGSTFTIIIPVALF